MESEVLPLIRELCHIAHVRNMINQRRHRGRFRKNYYSHAVKVVEAHLGSNWELRNLDPQRHGARIQQVKDQMAWLRQKHPKPKKWIQMGLHQLRSLSLKGEADYAQAKHETMELSIKTRSRVKDLVSKIGCSIIYNNGSIDAIRIKESGSFLGRKEIESYARDFILSKATDEFLSR